MYKIQIKRKGREARRKLLEDSAISQKSFREGGENNINYTDELICICCFLRCQLIIIL